MAFCRGASCRLTTRPVSVRESAWPPRWGKGAAAGNAEAIAIEASASVATDSSLFIEGASSGTSRRFLFQMNANILAFLPIYMNPGFAFKFLLFRHLRLAIPAHG